MKITTAEWMRIAICLLQDPPRSEELKKVQGVIVAMGEEAVAGAMMEARSDSPCRRMSVLLDLLQREDT